MKGEPECLDEVVRGKGRATLSRPMAGAGVVPRCSGHKQIKQLVLLASKIKELTRLLVSGQLFV